MISDLEGQGATSFWLECSVSLPCCGKREKEGKELRGSRDCPTVSMSGRLHLEPWPVNVLPATIFLLGNEGISGHFSPSSSQVSVGLVLCVILAKQACQSLTFLSGACRPVMLLNLSLPGVFSALWEILNMWPKSVDIGMEVT